MKAFALKAFIRQQGCELKRIGRSRNWLLKANFDQLQTITDFIDNASEPSWAWLSKLLNKQYQDLSHDELLRIGSMLTEVTVGSLIAKSHCTIAQARRVIDELEGLD